MPFIYSINGTITAYENRFTEHIAEFTVEK